MLSRSLLFDSSWPFGVQPDSSVHGIFQARILEWVAIFSPRVSSWPRNWTCISLVSCIADGFFTCWATGEALGPVSGGQNMKDLADHWKHSDICHFCVYLSLRPIEKPHKIRKTQSQNCPTITCLSYYSVVVWIYVGYSAEERGWGGGFISNYQTFCFHEVQSAFALMFHAWL